MGVIVSCIIALGPDQIGYAENPLGSNRTKYGNFWDTPKSKNGPYPFFNGKKNGECGWCCEYSIWESAMAIQKILGWDYDKIRVWLGMPKNPADNAGAGAPHLYKYMKKWEVDKTKGQPGDYIFFNTKLGKCAHVGRIEEVSGGKYKTVEGNKSNMVAYGSYSINSSSIFAVIHVPYETIEPSPEPPTPTGTTYKVATKYQPLTVRKEPTTKSDEAGELAKGSTFTSSEVVKGESVHGCDAWVKVDKGYANGYYLSPTPVVEAEPTLEPLPVPKPIKPEPVIQKYKVKTNTGAPLALRYAPNTQAVCCVWMPNKSEVTVTDFVKGQKIGGCDQWARTTYKGKSGYCLSKYLAKA